MDKEDENPKENHPPKDIKQNEEKSKDENQNNQKQKDEEKEKEHYKKSRKQKHYQKYYQNIWRISDVFEGKQWMEWWISFIIWHCKTLVYVVPSFWASFFNS